MNATLETAPKASREEMDFVAAIANPTDVLEIISKGQDAVRAAGDNEAAIEAAIKGTWLEIAELEGDDVATTITDTVWKTAA
jgi:hypothetical protein